MRASYEPTFGYLALNSPPTLAFDRHDSRESSLLREFDNVAVRVGDVERPFMPWPIHRSAEDLDTEPSQPLRFPIYVFNQEARNDATADSRLWPHTHSDPHIVPAS
jgi:hypothetical protein